MRFTIGLLLFQPFLIHGNEDYRLWTNKEGLEIKAKFERFLKDKVEITRDDGLSFTLLTNLLSEDDQNYLDELKSRFEIENPDTFQSILSSAIDSKETFKDKNNSGWLKFHAKPYQAPGQNKSYSGWMKGIYSNGRTQYLAKYRDGKLNGLVTVWDEKGKTTWRAYFKDGWRHGVEEHYNEGKLWWAVSFRKGKEHGPYLMYYNLTKKNGQVIKVKHSVGNWINGKKVGDWITYHENGVEKNRYTFDQNGLISNKVVIYYNADGSEARRRYFKNGKRDLIAELANHSLDEFNGDGLYKLEENNTVGKVLDIALSEEELTASKIDDSTSEYFYRDKPYTGWLKFTQGSHVILSFIKNGLHNGLHIQWKRDYRNDRWYKHIVARFESGSPLQISQFDSDGKISSETKYKGRNPINK